MTALVAGVVHLTIHGITNFLSKEVDDSSDAPIPVSTDRSDIDISQVEMADTDPIPILGTKHFLREIHSMLHIYSFLCAYYKTFCIKTSRSCT